MVSRSLLSQNGDNLLGGQNYNVTGSQQILSIPYALYAEEAASVDYQNITNRPTGQNGGDILYWNANTQTWDVLPVGLPGQYLIVSNNGRLAWNSLNIDTSQLSNMVPTVRTHPVTNVHAFTELGMVKLQMWDNPGLLRQVYVGV